MSEDSLEGHRIVEPTIQTRRSLMITDLDSTEHEIGMIGDSVIGQPVETNDRRLQSLQMHSDTSMITDLDRTEHEIGTTVNPSIIQPNESNYRSLQNPQIHSTISRITDLDRTEPEIGMIGESLVIQSGETNDRRVASFQINSDSCKITDLDDPLPRLPEIEDSSSCPDPGAQIEESADRTLDISTLSDATFESNTFGTRVHRTPNRQLTYIKPWKTTVQPEVRSCVTPEGKFATAVSFKLRASSTPQGSPVSIFAASSVANVTRPDNHQELTSGFPMSSSEKLEKPPSPTSTTSSTTPEVEEICDACRADPSRSKPSRSSNGRPASGFRPRNLLPPIGEKPSNGSSASLVSLSSKKKSSELEGMIKRNTARPGKSLVQEIIEELNEKCRSSAQSTYISPGSKNFVKKLVKALEKGETPSLPEDDEDSSYRRFDGPGEYEEYDCSEDDAKSAAASTSISYKDTDSSSTGSDTDLRSPTMKIGYNYDCNMNVEKNRNDQTGSATIGTKIGMVTSTPDPEEKVEMLSSIR